MDIWSGHISKHGVTSISEIGLGVAMVYLQVVQLYYGTNIFLVFPEASIFAVIVATTTYTPSSNEQVSFFPYILINLPCNFIFNFLRILYEYWNFHSLPTSNPSVSFLLPPKSMTYYIHNWLSPFSVAHIPMYLGWPLLLALLSWGALSSHWLSVVQVGMWPCDVPLMLACQLALSLCRACLGGHITMLWFYGFSILVSSRHCPAAGIIVLALTSFWFAFHEVPQAVVGWLIVLNNDRAIYHGEIT